MIAEDHWEHMFERRMVHRTRVSKSAKLFFNTIGDPFVCGIRDITDAGAGIRADGLNVLPIYFEFSLGNLMNTRKCRLIWRDGDFMGVAFLA